MTAKRKKATRTTKASGPSKEARKRRKKLEKEGKLPTWHKNKFEIGEPIPEGNPHPREAKIREDIAKLFPKLGEKKLHALAHEVFEAVTDYKVNTATDGDYETTPKKLKRDANSLIKALSRLRDNKLLQDMINSDLVLDAAHHGDPSPQLLFSDIGPAHEQVTINQLLTSCKVVQKRIAGSAKRGHPREIHLEELVRRIALAFKTATRGEPDNLYTDPLLTLIEYVFKAIKVNRKHEGLRSLVRRALKL